VSMPHERVYFILVCKYVKQSVV